MKWEEAVATARTAITKTFEGRMEAAKASFTVIPENGKGAGGHTLAEFAEELGISYGSIDEYRRVWLWLGKSFGHMPEIGAYSIAREAMKSKLWSSAKSFLAARGKADLPTGFKSWTLDAVRIGMLNVQPTNTGQIQRRAAQTGVEPSKDEIAAASAADKATQAQQAAEEITDPAQSRKARTAIDKAGQKTNQTHQRNVSNSMPPAGDPDPGAQSFKDVLKNAGATDLAMKIADTAQLLRELLGQVPEWLDEYGHIELEGTPEEGGDTTIGAVLIDTIQQERETTTMAFDGATGNIDQSFQKLLDN